MVETLKDQGVDVAETVTYPLDPGRAQELSASAIARFKEAGVTTVILRADPITAPGVHQRGHRAELVPGVVPGRLPVHRHHHVRPGLRPGAVGARVRHQLHAAARRRPRSRRPTSSTSGTSASPPPADNALDPHLPAGGAVLHRRRVRRPRPHGRELPRRHLRLPAHPQRRHPALRRLRPGHLGRGRLLRHRRHGRALVGPRRHGPRRDRRGRQRHVPLRRRGQALPARRVHERAQRVRRGGVADPHHRPAGGRGPARLPVAGGS